MSTVGPGSSVAVVQAATGPPSGGSRSAVPRGGQPSVIAGLLAMFKVSSWKRIPFPLFLLILWSLLRWFGASMSFGSVIGLVFIALTFVALILEFWKSGDIALPSFVRDQVLAVIAVAAWAVGITLIFEHRTFYVVDAFVGLLVLVDGIMSPVNSFRTALRNVQAGISQGSHDPVQ